VFYRPVSSSSKSPNGLLPDKGAPGHSAASLAASVWQPCSLRDWLEANFHIPVYRGMIDSRDSERGSACPLIVVLSAGVAQGRLRPFRQPLSATNTLNATAGEGAASRLTDAFWMDSGPKSFVMLFITSYFKSPVTYDNPMAWLGPWQGRPSLMAEQLAHRSGTHFRQGRQKALFCFSFRNLSASSILSGSATLRRANHEFEVTPARSSYPDT
jgi:hypothetical protein